MQHIKNLNVGLIGSIAVYINGKKYEDTDRTTPESLVLCELFDMMLKEDVTNHISKHLRMKFNQYRRVLNYWNEQLQYTNEDVVNLIVNYLNAEYHSSFEQKKDEFYKVLTLQKKYRK